MRVRLEEDEVAPFTPFKLELEFQSQEEVDMFYAIFNFSPICAVMRSCVDGGAKMAQKIRDELREKRTKVGKGIYHKGLINMSAHH